MNSIKLSMTHQEECSLDQDSQVRLLWHYGQKQLGLEKSDDDLDQRACSERHGEQRK